MKGTISAQKSPQGSETKRRELLEGTEEYCVSPNMGHLFTFTQRLIICLSGPLIFDCLRPPRYTHRERRSLCMISKGLIDDVVAGRKGWSSPSLTASHYFSLQHHLVFMAYWSPQSSRIVALKSKSIFHQKVYHGSLFRNYVNKK